MANQTTVNHETRVAIIKRWDETRGAYPRVTTVEIAQEFGVHKDTVRRCIDRRDAVLKREGITVKPMLPAQVISAAVSSHVVMAIPDMHHPFAHPDTLAFLQAVKRKYSPTKYICLGDEIDACAFSKYPKDPDGLAAGLEITKAREALIPFYIEFPEMLVCESNHTVRPWKMAFQSGLPASFLPSYATFLNAPDGWQWAHSHVIDGVRYIHGEGRSGFNAHVHFMRGYKQSVVIGHIHSYAAVSHEGGLFAVNSGCLIDKQAFCFKYAKNMPIDVNLGCTIIHHGKRAEFIPMICDASGRWCGEL